MMSGTLTRGAWVFRRTELLELLSNSEPRPLWAEAAETMRRSGTASKNLVML